MNMCASNSEQGEVDYSCSAGAWSTTKEPAVRGFGGEGKNNHVPGCGGISPKCDLHMVYFSGFKPGVAHLLIINSGCLGERDIGEYTRGMLTIDE